MEETKESTLEIDKKEKPTWKIVAISSLISVLVTLLVIGVIASVFFLNFYQKGNFFNQPGSRARNQRIVLSYKDANPVVAIAQKARPAVVSIRVEKVTYQPDFFAPFFEAKRLVKGIGSGVVFRPDGYILTNNHVVSGATNISVTFYNGDVVKGKVIGSDVESDIAVVKVDKENLEAAEIGTSKDLKVGELVVAIGSPFGFDYTVTSGVISALNRTVTTDSEEGTPITFVNLIQTDAAINPGNSGGALLNAKGQVIGINTLIYSRTEGYQGIGFAIPIDTALDAAQQLIAKKKVQHPFLGINGVSVTPEVAQEKGLKVSKGALVGNVFPDTPADKAGIMPGDIIISFNGKEILSMDDLIIETRKHKVGEKVKLGIVRDGKEITVEVVLAEKTDYRF